VKPSPDWTKLAEPDPSVAGDFRSCANCLHMRDGGWRNDPVFWFCARTMRVCYHEITFSDSQCGRNLRLWTAIPPKPPGFWRRLFRKGHT
jgi:hypothetical protein